MTWTSRCRTINCHILNIIPVIEHPRQTIRLNAICSTSGFCCRLRNVNAIFAAHWMKILALLYGVTSASDYFAIWSKLVKVVIKNYTMSVLPFHYYEGFHITLVIFFRFILYYYFYMHLDIFYELCSIQLCQFIV